ncbi:DHS-like NAD/FAD-binding domain-containing protein [Leucosporidium creatinivorum]|uniref:DHS-like NAD/FAD-binding domain-containing protein n=1 Tax=Leucosporidium creatinivorum TaxID=106004 RepID=A0A1Y2D818_9BASI|nr:DHS-like NAD/FAD-binding domain-containing protein [Leucosporidium creatinivorum]
MSLPILSFGGVSPPSKTSLPPFPCTHLDPSTEDPAQLSLQHVAKAVIKAKRVAVVCGAGISCASGIPDFPPEARLNSGKDLFDARLFASEQNASIFYTMIAELKAMADKAQPTAFHSFLKTLDDEGKLFRVYTQNIDGLEEKAGLSYGLGDKTLPLPPRRATRSPTKVSQQPLASTSKSAPPPSLTTTTKRATKNSVSASLSLPYPSPAPSPPRDASPPPPTHSQIPRCIPLHGHLGTVSCGHCSTTLPIAPYLSDLASGSSTPCPKCTTIDDARASLGERSRGVGRLRPDVVLYGEEHKDGERVGEITRRDLMGVRPDLLLVVGTSLKVPGTKRLVRELAKVIRPTWVGGEEEEDGDEEIPSASAGSTSSATGRRKGAKPPPVHVVYLNYEFPKPSSEWKDVFDVWMRGDVQGFVGEVEKERKAEAERVEGRRKEKEAKERRRVEKEKAAAAGGKTATSSAGTTTKKAVASKSRSKAMVPNNGLSATTTTSSKTKTLGGAAKPRARASIAKASPPPPSSQLTSFTTRTRSSRSPSATSTASSTATTATGRRTANSRSASVTSVAPSLPSTRRQQFTLTFNVTKASVASVTGTKGRKGSA